MKYLIILFFILSAFSVMAGDRLFEINGIAKGKDGQRVELVRYTAGGTDRLGVDTIRNGKFHLSCPVDETGPAVVQVNRNFGGTVVLEAATIQFTLNEDGSYSLKGGKYNPVVLGFLRSKEYLATDAALRELTKGGDMSTVKGTKDEWKMVQLFLRKEELRSLYLDSIREANPDPYVKLTAAVMTELQPDQKKTMVMVNEIAGKIGENSNLVKRLRSMDQQQTAALERRHAGMLGESFADFTALTLKGDHVQLAPIVMQHKYTLLQFWASWCGPCRKEIPLLKQLYSKYKPGGFEIVSFSMDDNKYSWEKVSEVEQLSWYNLSDLQAFKSDIAKHYPINGIPSNVIIDQQGKIVASNLTGDDLENKINSLFK